ncbi:hypothetical protein GC173_03745 [bacterium]|nr:hypothetical protein [bacterium]
MMKRLSLSLFLLAALLIFAGTLAAQTPAGEDEMDSLATGPVAETPRELQAEFIVPSTPVEVGVPFPIRVKVLIPGDFEKLILTQDKFGVAYLVGEEFRPIGNNEFVASYRVRKPGDHTFNPQVFGKTAGSEEAIRLSSAPFKLTVKEPAAEASTSSHGFPDVRAIPFDYTWRNVVLGAASVLLLIVLVILGFVVAAILRKRASNVPPITVRPPIELALEEVKLLSSLEIFLVRGSDAHYTALSMALRRYLEGQFGVPAAEMTEDEVIDFIRRNLDTANQAAVLNQVLTRSSLAKFARQPISREIAGEDCDASLKFLQREQQRLEAADAARRAREAQADRSAA